MMANSVSFIVSASTRKSQMLMSGHMPSVQSLVSTLTGFFLLPPPPPPSPLPPPALLLLLHAPGSFPGTVRTRADDAGNVRPVLGTRRTCGSRIQLHELFD